MPSIRYIGACEQSSVFVYCPQCETANEDTAERCSTCGHLLRAPQQVLAAQERLVPGEPTVSEPLILAKGINGQIDVYADKISIKRKGFTSFLFHGFKGDKEIRITSITAVQFKKASALANGYIQFAFMGSNEAKGGFFQATQDENTVMFRKGQQAAFERVKQYVQDQQRAPSMSAGPTSSGADEIAKFAQLKDQGILTEEEFQAKKKEILGL